MVAESVKNPLAMQLRALAWEDPLEEGMAAHSIILARRIPMDRGTWRAAVHRVAKSRSRLSNEAQLMTYIYICVVGQTIKLTVSLRIKRAWAA